MHYNEIRCIILSIVSYYFHCPLYYIVYCTLFYIVFHCILYHMCCHGTLYSIVYCSILVVLYIVSYCILYHIVIHCWTQTAGVLGPAKLEVSSNIYLSQTGRVTSVTRVLRGCNSLLSLQGPDPRLPAPAAAAPGRRSGPGPGTGNPLMCCRSTEGEVGGCHNFLSRRALMFRVGVS